MRIGPLTIQPDVLLAPMAAVTDLPFRTVCEEFGLGLTITEFLSANAICQGADKTIAKMTPSLGGRRFGVQIFGREPHLLAQAAQQALHIGASLVDINMGCPAKRVVAGACGAALMREPELAQELVRAVRAALPPTVPVTVKHRAGWDERHLNAPEFACAMVEAGAAMITVHGRTRAQGFSGTCSREIIARVRQAVPAHVPVVGNGDVVTVDDYFAMRQETGCDAVMIGRGALGNPWLFRSIAARLAGRPDPGPPTIEERRSVFVRHVQLICELTPERRVLHELRKAVAWYTKGLPRSADLRDRVAELQAPVAIMDETMQYFSALQDRVFRNTGPADAGQDDPRAVREKLLAPRTSIDNDQRPVA
ncbi:MAG: tRNA dihydrouridine synthase DusB [Myxococcales bacterium]|nr:tRNA dihydrouridine synthase DusB [Myxococcota bacterium]MDW8283259.1 tRNA dihydrouridine synthase DusB [Myxococcales bacterium]